MPKFKLRLTSLIYWLSKITRSLRKDKKQNSKSSPNRRAVTSHNNISTWRSYWLWWGWVGFVTRVLFLDYLFASHFEQTARWIPLSLQFFEITRWMLIYFPFLHPGLTKVFSKRMIFSWVPILLRFISRSCRVVSVVCRCWRLAGFISRHLVRRDPSPAADEDPDLRWPRLRWTAASNTCEI